MSAGPFVDTRVPLPTVEPPPPGPPGMCGHLGEACCADQICNEGMACNAYDIYQDKPDYYPNWFTCQACGGFDLDDYNPSSRVGQLACNGEYLTYTYVLFLLL
jgi:hypothetical protein